MMEIPEGMVRAYERLHYFHGQKLDVRDFEDDQHYFIERRRIHHWIFHTPGVVLGLLGDLKVSPLGKGDPSLLVEPGLAIDGRGEDLLLPERIIVRIDPVRLTLPGTVYVVLRLVEEPGDFLEDPDHPEYQGHRRVRESAAVEIIDQPPRPEGEVELARVHLTRQVTEIRLPADPETPGPGDLDLRFVPRAISVVRLPAEVERALRGHLQRLRSLDAPREVLFAAHSACLTLSPPPRNAALADALRFLLSLLALHGFPSSRPLPSGDEACILTATSVLGEIVPDLESRLRSAPVDAVPMTLEEISIRGGEPPISIDLGGRIYRMVDRIDAGDPPSEEEHGFSAVGCRHDWPLRNTFTYPDGTPVTDRGRVLIGGAARFLVRDLAPRRDLIILRRMDISRSRGAAEVTIDGKGIPGRWMGSLEDGRHRWRNGVMHLPPTLVSRAEVEIRIGAPEDLRGADMYRLWFYQPDTCAIMLHNGWGSAGRRSP